MFPGLSNDFTTGQADEQQAGEQGNGWGEQWRSHTHHARSDQELESVSMGSALLELRCFFPCVSVYVSKTTYESIDKTHKSARLHFSLTLVQSKTLPSLE